jgi:hypothetical protein
MIIHKYRYLNFFLLLIFWLGLSNCSKENCEDIEFTKGNHLISDCPQGEDQYFTMLINGYCWHTTFWKIEEFEKYFELRTTGFSSLIENARQDLILTIPHHLVGADFQALMSSAEDKSDVPTIQVDISTHWGKFLGSYTIACRGEETNNSISFNFTTHPVILECSIESYVVKNEEDSDSIPEIIHISDSKIRIPTTTVKQPKDLINLCEDTLSAEMLFNGECRNATATHSFYWGGTQLSLDAKPFLYTESLYISLPLSYEVGRMYEVLSSYDPGNHELNFFITDYDVSYAGYDIYNPNSNSLSYIVIDAVNADSTVIEGRVQAFFEKDGEYSNFGTYDFIHIEECSFRSDLR